MQELGKVINQNEKEISIEFQRSSMCDKCGQCGLHQAKNIVIQLKNDNNITIGDYVLVEMPLKNVGLASIIVYVVPLLLLLLSIIMGKPLGTMINKNGDITGAVLALMVLTIYFFGVKRFEPMIKKKQQYKPYIVKVLDEQEAKNFETCNSNLWQENAGPEVKK